MQRQTTFPEFVLFLLIGVGVLTVGVAVSGMRQDEVAPIDSPAVVSGSQPGAIGAARAPERGGRAGVVLGTVVGLLIGAVVGAAGRVRGDAAGLSKQPVVTLDDSLQPGPPVVIAVKDVQRVSVGQPQRVTW